MPLLLLVADCNCSRNQVHRIDVGGEDTVGGDGGAAGENSLLDVVEHDRVLRNLLADILRSLQRGHEFVTKVEPVVDVVRGVEEKQEQGLEQEQEEQERMTKWYRNERHEMTTDLMTLGAFLLPFFYFLFPV